jgi:predicted O-methyltransferase YrrM
MNEVLQSIVSSGSVVTEGGKRRTCDVGIGQEEGEFLQEIIRRQRPQVSVEVGCAYGISSLYICEALREVNAAKHIIMDPWQHGSSWQGIGIANLKRAGYADIIDFHEVPSYQYLSRLTEEHVKIDFAFIDGYHKFDYVLVDFFLIDKLLKPDGIVVLDDFTYPEIRSVCRYVLLNLPYKCIGPQSRKLPELAQCRRLASRVRQGNIGPLCKSPWGRMLMPAWRMIVWRGGRLVKAPLRRLLASRASVPDSELNLPDGVNYVALQKLRDDDRHWAAHDRLNFP